MDLISSKQQIIYNNWVEVIGKEEADKIIPHLNNDGWLSIDFPYYTDKKCIFDFEDQPTFPNSLYDESMFRPISLRMIDWNNGWKEINSINDLENLNEYNNPFLFNSTYGYMASNDQSVYEGSFKKYGLIDLYKKGKLTHYKVDFRKSPPII